MTISKHLISEKTTLFESLQKLNQLRIDLNLFVIDEEERLLGSVTDGDIRRGIVKGIGLDQNIKSVMNSRCSYLKEKKIDLLAISELRKKGIKILPIVNDRHQVIDLLNFNRIKTLLPVDAVVMAGGKGSRLAPLTQSIPKPLLLVGGKPIILYNLERMQQFGIRNITITVNYLKEQIETFVRELPANGNNIHCVSEPKALGTAGAVSLINDWCNDYILLTNSDLLTNIDYEDFFIEFMRSGADMMVAAIPYPIKIPYAILETSGNDVTAFKEKPEYTYYANMGMYLFKKELLDFIPKKSFYNATDLMDKLLEEKRKLSYYPMVNYWLDIGSHDDYKKAQEDIKHLKF